MRLFVLLIIIHCAAISYGQQNISKLSNNTDTVSFIVKFDKRNATKDGYYLGGYVVNIDYNKAKKLNGKTIRITGKVSIEKSISSKQNADSSTIIQGRSKDIKHIESPIIEIIPSTK